MNLRSVDAIARLLDPEETPGRLIRIPHPWIRGKCPAEGYDPIPIAAYQSRIDRRWGEVSWEYFGDGILALQNALLPLGGVVFAFGYDWRESNRTSGRRLLDLLKKLEGHFAFPPIVVTHSMGGIVARCAHLLEKEKGEASSIAGIIHTVMPTHGAPELFAKFHEGEGVTLVPSLAKIIGQNRWDFVRTAACIPSVCELLPNHIYPDASWMHVDPEVWSELRMTPTSDWYALYKEPSGRIGLADRRRLEKENYGRLAKKLDKHIEESRKLHEDLERCGAHPRTTVVSGVGLKTTVGYEFLQPQSVPTQGGRMGRIADYFGSSTRTKGRRFGDGDETVPLVSAEAFGPGSGGRVSDVSHEKALNHPDMIKLILELVHEEMGHMLKSTGGSKGSP